jgi:phosphoglycolate phosphatase-like HAD superfamily hydrolase
MDARPRVKAVAIDLEALGDTQRLWEDWRSDAARRLRVDAGAIETEIPNWEHLLARFAEERAPVYLRPDAETSDVLRRLQAGRVKLGVFTERPEALARVALAQLGARRRVDVLEAGADALPRVLERLGADAVVVRTRAELLDLR